MSSQDLFAVIGDVPCDETTGHCMSPSAFHPNQKKFYWDWEDEIAAPKLKELGYEIIRWSDGERDSFGPLSRCVTVKKDGVNQTLVYG